MVLIGRRNLHKGCATLREVWKISLRHLETVQGFLIRYDIIWYDMWRDVVWYIGKIIHLLNSPFIQPQPCFTDLLQVQEFSSLLPPACLSSMGKSITLGFAIWEESRVFSAEQIFFLQRQCPGFSLSSRWLALVDGSGRRCRRARSGEDCGLYAKATGSTLCCSDGFSQLSSVDLGAFAAQRSGLGERISAGLTGLGTASALRTVSGRTPELKRASCFWPVRNGKNKRALAALCPCR